MPKLRVVMRNPCDLVVRGFHNYLRPKKFRRSPNPTVMRQQVPVIRDILLNDGVHVDYRLDGHQFPDATFVYDHAFFVMILNRSYAFLPCRNWPRHEEMPLDLPFIKEHAETIQPPCHFKGRNLRFDPGTVVQGHDGVAIGYSKSRGSRTNKTGAQFVKAKLIELGYVGKIVIVRYIGLHLSTFCTCISTADIPTPVFLANSFYVKDIDLLAELGEVIEVDTQEAWRANAIAHRAMRSLILMKRWLPGEDLLLNTLLARGYKVEVVELTESPCVQGSLFCHALMFEAAV